MFIRRVCPERQNVTNNIVCTACGGVGHIAKDCRTKRPGMGGVAAADSQAKIDEEYMSLMAELGEGPEPPPPATEINTKSNNMPVIPNIPRNNFSNLFESKPAPRPIMPAAPPVSQPPIETRPPPGPPAPPQPPNMWPPPAIPSLMSNPPIPGLNGAPLNPPILPSNPPAFNNNWNHQPCPPGEGQPEIPGVSTPNSWNPPPPQMPPSSFPNNSFNCFPPIPNLTLPPPPPPPS